MNSNLLTSLIITTVLLQTFSSIALPQQVYKWTDAAGQVHYGQQKPEGAAQTQMQTIDITPPPPSTAPGSTDSTAEIARINALSEQMAREREAVEQTRQEQAIRDLEQQNQQLQNDLLKQQQQAQSDNNNDILVGSSPYYPSPYFNSYPPRPPDHGPPCQPWPDCHQHRPMPPPEPIRPQPRPKPNPPFRPSPSEAPETVPGGFRGR